MLKKAIQKLVEKKNIDETEIMDVMECIIEGGATQAQIGSFLTALRLKGETVEEITGCAKAMRKKAEKIRPNVRFLIDTCGTGGDNSNTFNISTASAIVAAAGGACVAKHGNRSVSSKSGSADVLEALGVNIMLKPGQVKECIEKTGIGFLFAPTFHKSMKHAAGPRKELGIRTIFNILGPLTNPADANGQVLGVYDRDLTEPIANVLANLGVERALVIHGLDGLDEITTTSFTRISELKNGRVVTYELNPEKFNLNTASKKDLEGGVAEENASIINLIFEGAKGPGRDVVLINAAAALYVGKITDSFNEGVETSKEIIDSGKAKAKLCELRDYSNSFAY